MMFRLFAKKGQSTAEYAILIGVVIAAAVGIQTYVKRGLQAKFKTEVDTFVAKSSNLQADVNDYRVASFQYEEDDYYARSSQETVSSNATSILYKKGEVHRQSTAVLHLGTDQDYRIYQYDE